MPNGLVEFDSPSPHPEPTIAEGEVAAAKGVGRVGRCCSPCQGDLAHVGRVDPELFGRQSGFEKRHRHRIRFLAGGAGHAQDAERRPARGGGVRCGMLLQSIEDRRVPEEPAFRHDHLLDEPALLRGIAGEAGDECIFIRFAAGLHPHPHGAGDGVSAHGVRIEPDPTLQQRLGSKACLGRAGGDRLCGVGMHGAAVIMTRIARRSMPGRERRGRRSNPVAAGAPP